jgi:hypothetical protein
MLAFEPMTGAIGMYIVEHACRTRPSHIVPRTQVLFRRVHEVLLDTAVNEAAEPLLDQVVNTMDIHILALLVAALVLWKHHTALLAALSPHRLE